MFRNSWPIVISTFSLYGGLNAALHLSTFKATYIKTSKPNLCKQKEFVYGLKNYTLVSASSIGSLLLPIVMEPFSLFRQLCLYIHVSDSLHLFTLFLTDSLEKCQTKSFENEYSTFCNFQILYHESTLQLCFSSVVI